MRCVSPRLNDYRIFSKDKNKVDIVVFSPLVRDKSFWRVTTFAKICHRENPRNGINLIFRGADDTHVECSLVFRFSFCVVIFVLGHK